MIKVLYPAILLLCACTSQAEKDLQMDRNACELARLQGKDETPNCMRLLANDHFVRIDYKVKK